MFKETAYFKQINIRNYLRETTKNFVLKVIIHHSGNSDQQSAVFTFDTGESIHFSELFAPLTLD